MIRRVPILLAILFIASCDAEDLPTAPEASEPTSVVANFHELSDDPVFLLLDEDAIGEGLAPNDFTAGEVNEDIAEVGLRTELPFFAANTGETLTLHSGEVGDEGWFALTEIPKNWDRAGPADGLRNYVAAERGLGGGPVAQPRHSEPRDHRGRDREALLGKIPGVTPLRATGLKQLEGQAVCAVVYKSDISINYDPLDGNLKGDNLGIVAFVVLSVTRLREEEEEEEEEESSLPEVRISILVAGVVCGDPDLTLFDDPPPIISSSEPFDVTPEDADVEQDLIECLSEAIDCDVGVVENNEGGTFAVFQGPGGVEQTLAAFLTIPPGVVVDEVDFKLTMKHVVTPPSEDIPEDDQIPFFIEITAEALEGDDPVEFVSPGATLVLCQPPNLNETIPAALHKFLKIFQVTDDGEGSETVILDTGIDDDSCPGGFHGGLVTIEGGEGFGGLFSFSGFGSTLVLPATPPASGSFVYSSQESEGPEKIFVNEAGVVRLITDDAATPAPDWRGNLIAFGRDGDIWIIDDAGDASDPGGATAVNLTDSGTLDLGPHWSPDGSRIAFSRHQGSGVFDVFVMDANGDNQFNLTNNSANDGSPSWSPDGSLIAFHSDRDSDDGLDVYVMSSSGGGSVTQLTFDTFPLEGGTPDWSPDGNKITFSRFDIGDEGAIWIMDEDGSNQEQLTASDSLDFNPAWSVDGSQILFTRFPVPSGTGDILRVTVADGLTGPGAVTSANERSPAWQKAGGGFPDLEITQLGINFLNPDNNDALKYSVEVSNLGVLAASSFTVEVSLFSGGMCGDLGLMLESSIGHVVSGLAAFEEPGDSELIDDISFGSFPSQSESSTLSNGFYCLTAEADVDDEVFETEEGDNVVEFDFTVGES